MKRACESGEYTGEECRSGDTATARVTFVPKDRRGTAKAARTWSGLSEVVVVCAGCAGDIAGYEDAEWYRVRDDT